MLAVEIIEDAKDGVNCVLKNFLTNFNFEYY